jgi:hypothetical protein
MVFIVQTIAQTFAENQWFTALAGRWRIDNICIGNKNLFNQKMKRAY